jgi:drug/metabolite transporter (DMT)-like permease
VPGLLIGIVAAIGASALYAIGIALQATEARIAPESHALRLSLFVRLVKRPRWVLGTALGLTGWALQALALTHAPLTLVQPLLGSSLVFLLGLSVWHLGEHVTRNHVLAVLAIAVGTPLLALTSPHHHSAHAVGALLWLTLGALGFTALSPLALRGSARTASLLVPIGAGLAYSWDGLATKFASDDYLRHAWIALAFWFVAMNIASGLGTLSEMSALQRRPVAQVAPLVFALTTFVPVALAPAIAREWWSTSALRDLGLFVSLALVGGGALALARSRPVVRALAAEATSSVSDTARRSLDASNASAAVSESRA